MVDYIKNETEKHQIALFYALVFTIILTSVFYMYFISAIMVQTVNRDSNLQSLQVAKREYQELEQSYLALLSRFNLNYAYSLGFVGESSLNFISRQSQMAQNSGHVQTIIR